MRFWSKSRSVREKGAHAATTSTRTLVSFPDWSGAAEAQQQQNLVMQLDEEHKADSTQQGDEQAGH